MHAEQTPKEKKERRGVYKATRLSLVPLTCYYYLPESACNFLSFFFLYTVCVCVWGGDVRVGGCLRTRACACVCVDHCVYLGGVDSVIQSAYASYTLSFTHQEEDG